MVASPERGASARRCLRMARTCRLAAGDTRSATKAAAPGSACTPCGMRNTRGPAHHRGSARAAIHAVAGSTRDALLVRCERAGQNVYAALAPFVSRHRAMGSGFRARLSGRAARALDDIAIDTGSRGRFAARRIGKHWVRLHRDSSRGCATPPGRTARRCDRRRAAPDPAATGRTLMPAQLQGRVHADRLRARREIEIWTAASARSSANRPPKRARATRRLWIVLPGFIDLHVHGGGGARHHGRRRRRADRRRTARAARHDEPARHDDDRAARRPRCARRRGLGEPCAKRAHRAARACSACTSKARTSTPASSARSRTSRASPCATKC